MLIVIIAHHRFHISYRIEHNSSIVVVTAETMRSRRRSLPLTVRKCSATRHYHQHQYFMSWYSSRLLQPNSRYVLHVSIISISSYFTVHQQFVAVVINLSARRTGVISRTVSSVSPAFSHHQVNTVRSSRRQLTVSNSSSACGFRQCIGRRLLPVWYQPVTSASARHAQLSLPSLFQQNSRMAIILQAFTLQPYMVITRFNTSIVIEFSITSFLPLHHHQ